VSIKRLLNTHSLTLSVFECFSVCQNFGVCVRNSKTIFQSNQSKIYFENFSKKQSSNQTKYNRGKNSSKQSSNQILITHSTQVFLIKYNIYRYRECSTQIMPARCAGLYLLLFRTFDLKLPVTGNWKAHNIISYNIPNSTSPLGRRCSKKIASRIFFEMKIELNKPVSSSEVKVDLVMYQLDRQLLGQTSRTQGIQY
jgi:hypothetical protein